MMSNSHLKETPSTKQTIDRLLTNRAQLILALMLIAFGGVFVLGEADMLDRRGSWWVIFIAIPGFVILGSGIADYLQTRQLSTGIGALVGFGLVLLLLSAILVWDPTWSFTRGWDDRFPFLRDLGQLWHWLLVLLGVASIYIAYRQQTVTVGVLGGVLCVIGAVFILNISWSFVWPMAIVAVGIWLLFFRNDRSQ
jgi:hypothetical protein